MWAADALFLCGSWASCFKDSDQIQLLFFRFYKTYNKVSVFITRDRKSVDFRLLRRLQLDVLSTELSSVLPGHQLITSQADIQSLVSLRRSFKLYIRGFVKRVHVIEFVSALRSFWTSRLTGNFVISPWYLFSVSLFLTYLCYINLLILFLSIIRIAWRCRGRSVVF